MYVSPCGNTRRRFTQDRKLNTDLRRTSDLIIKYTKYTPTHIDHLVIKTGLRSAAVNGYQILCRLFNAVTKHMPVYLIT